MDSKDRWIFLGRIKIVFSSIGAIRADFCQWQAINLPYDTDVPFLFHVSCHAQLYTGGGSNTGIGPKNLRNNSENGYSDFHAGFLALSDPNKRAEGSMDVDRR